MERNCEACGGSFESKRRDTRFCSSKCRLRAHRGGGTQVVELKAPAKKGRKEAAVQADGPSGPGEVEQATITQLEEAGRLDSPRGKAALVLARRLDAVTFDTGSAVAAVVRQWDATLEAAVAGAHMAADPVDEVRRRRDEKLSKLGIVS